MKNNIVFLIADALRARNLGCYGYDKPTSPNISNLAKSGVLFEKAFSTANATDPSLTSIFSGEYPITTGIRNHGERVTETEKRLAASLLTFPKKLKASGYTTLGVNWLGRWHKNGYDFYGVTSPRYYRFVASFLSFIRSKQFASKARQSVMPNVFNLSTSKHTTETAIQLLNRYKNNQFFLYVHFWGTHTPYNAPRSYSEYIYKFYNGVEKNEAIEDILKEPSMNKKWRMYLESWLKELPNLAYVLAQYDAAIAFLDKQIGRIYQTLIDLGILDITNIVITADHGESLCEHGIYFDHHGLYDETIHVPLIFSGPDFPKGKKVSSLVQHVDVVPTFLDILKNPINNSEFDGFSLLPLLTGEANHVHPFIISEELYTEDKKAIRTEKWKFITSPSKRTATCRYCNMIHGGIEELYNLESDPKEKSNVVGDEPQIAKKLRRELFDWLSDMKTKREKRRIKRKINNLCARVRKPVRLRKNHIFRIYQTHF